MCNYNRQSKTKPFTYNEFLSKKGRLPQGGILMKQMAECAQGQTQTVLLFTVCQHFQHSEELHLSLDCSLCASERIWVCMCVQKVLLIGKKKKIKQDHERRGKKKKKWTRDKKYSTQELLMFYSISFNFIQYVCLLTVRPFSAPHKRPATATVHVWLPCGLAQCLISRCRTITAQFPYCFYPWFPC